MNFTVKIISRAGIISALYVVLVFPVISLASGAIQFRPSEALTILPVFFPEATVALAIGCALANLITGCAILDIVFGAIITLIAGLCSYLVGRLNINKYLKFAVAGLFPIIFNALLLPLVWYFAYGELAMLYIFSVLSLLLTQSVSVYALGGILYFGIDKLKANDNPLFE